MPHIVRIEKLMSLSLVEFQLTVARLSGNPLDAQQTRVEIPLAPGHVSLNYEQLPGVRFGGLLDLPRALVSLTFDGVATPDSEAFLKRFDFTFQRGGG